MFRETIGERAGTQIAGISALMAGLCWIAWVVGTNLNFDAAGYGITRASKFIQLTIAGWNLLLIPAALHLWRRFSEINPELVLLATVGGIISLSFWAYGGATGTISPASEIVYLILSGMWWTVIGGALRRDTPTLGTVTTILGLMALLDALLSFLEPLPFYIYALAAPKLPLSIVWTFWIGVYILVSTRPRITPP